MRFVELFEDSQEQRELKSLIKSTDNNNRLTQIVDYLKSRVVKTKSQFNQKKIVSPADTNKVTTTNEDAINLKSQALQLIDQLDDPEELEKLISFLRRSEIADLSRRVITQKFGSVQGDLDKKLSALLTRIKNPFEQKINFLKTIIANGGIFDGSTLLSQKSGNIYNLIKNDPIADAIAKTLALQFRGAIGYGPDQGPGEIMMMLLGKNISPAEKGDLRIGNVLVEVKATGKGKSGLSGGRLTTTTGYGSSSNIRKILYPIMIDAGIPAEVLKQYGWPSKSVDEKTIAGGLNLNSSGLTNLSNLLKEYVSEDDAKNILKVMLDGIYTKLPSGFDDSMIDLVQPDGSFDPKKFMIELTKLAHKYYRFIEGHDALMLFNTENGNYVVIEDADDFDELFDSGKIGLTSHIDWHDDRARGSSQLVVK